MLATMMFLALQTAPSATAPLHQALIRLFDVVCNRTFPDDDRLAAAMAAIPGVKPLTPEQVKLFLKDDPGRGWALSDGATELIVTIEAPPVHACAVRMPHARYDLDEAMWHRLVDQAKARAGGHFTALPPQSFEGGGRRTIVVADQGRREDGSVEAFYFWRTSSADAAEAAREGTELRLVRQLIASEPVGKR